MLSSLSHLPSRCSCERHSWLSTPWNVKMPSSVFDNSWAFTRLRPQTLCLGSGVDPAEEIPFPEPPCGAQYPPYRPTSKPWLRYWLIVYSPFTIITLQVMQISRHPAPQVLQHHSIIDIETAGPTVNTQFLFYLFTCHLIRPSWRLCL